MCLELFYPPYKLYATKGVHVFKQRIVLPPPLYATKGVRVVNKTELCYLPPVYNKWCSCINRIILPPPKRNIIILPPSFHISVTNTILRIPLPSFHVQVA